MKTVPVAFLRVVFALAGACLATSCVSTTTPPAADHKPRIDYWQNGGGACCPQHARQFEAKRASAAKAKPAS